MKVNYQKIMQSELEKIREREVKPSLLLHACCAPCSSAVLKLLNDYFNITLYFYNPNISPKEEYDFRLEELKRLVSEMGMLNIEIVDAEYDNQEFEMIALGKEDLPEGGQRCAGCYRLRLERCADYAKANDFDYFTTTLSISPHKNAGLLNEIGLEFEKKYGVKYLCSDFKKGEGYKKSCELSKQYDLYRQDYCGCIYSKKIAESKRA